MGLYFSLVPYLKLYSLPNISDIFFLQYFSI